MDGVQDLRDTFGVALRDDERQEVAQVLQRTMQIDAHRLEAGLDVLFHEVPDLPREPSLLPRGVVEVRFDDPKLQLMVVRAQRGRLEDLDEAVPLERRQTHPADRGADTRLAAADNAQMGTDAGDFGFAQLQVAAAGAGVPQHRLVVGRRVHLRQHNLTDERVIETQWDLDLPSRRHLRAQDDGRENGTTNRAHHVEV